MKRCIFLVLVLVGLSPGCKGKDADPAAAAAAAKLAAAAKGAVTPAGSGASDLGSAAPSTGTCDAVAAHLSSLDVSLRWSSSSVDRKKMASLSPAAYKASVLVSCNRDGWSPEATTCFLNARDVAAGEACESKLTPDQGTALSNAFTDGLNATSAGSGSSMMGSAAY